jgi:peptidoglycan/xylan/chitin deacetylase (PgdA/CDA1 family)
VISAHAFLLADDRTKTGFDWAHDRGGEAIARIFAEDPELALEHTIETELYRIDRFVRLPSADAPSPKPSVEVMPIEVEIEHKVARHIVWGGATALRHEVYKTELRDTIPVLMYHRIADDGPAALSPYRVSPKNFHAQMRWLRQNGYHTITSDQLAWFVRRRRPFDGRPVVLSFDDAYEDFATTAWPILREHDFGADVFVVTDKIGETSDWDSRHGAPAPLMDAGTIGRLSAQGVWFGSHLASHRSAYGLSSAELADELLGSKAFLERLLKRDVSTLAAPFGHIDGRIRTLAEQCGYRVALTTRPGVASLGDHLLDLPRIEISGDLSIEEFVAQLTRCR